MNRTTFFLTLTMLGMMIASSSFALDIDEKLTLRILDVSSTGKTVLINRGVEDGLVVGDHAKFFITSGVIARGVVLKVSPTRSIWSIYRLVESDEITKDRVLTLKISAPVKVTPDPSKTITPVDEPSVGIEVAAEADDLPKDLSQSEQDDLAGLINDNEKGKSKARSSSSKSEGIDSSKLWQAFAYGSYSSFSSTLTEGSAITSFSSSVMAGGVGIERYFSDQSSFFHNISLYALAEMSLSSSSDQEVVEAPSFMQFGAGVSYHLINDPLSFGKVIPFFTVNGGIGSATTTYSETEANGSTNFVNAGGGFKYNWDGGLGMRVLATYSLRNETYTFDGGAVEQITFAHSGFGVNIGLSYRF